jgi:hypothetical protein
VLAAVSYWIPPMHLELWNRAASIVALILAVLSIAAAGIASVIPRRDSRQDAGEPAAAAAELNVPETG